MRYKNNEKLPADEPINYVAPQRARTTNKTGRVWGNVKLSIEKPNKSADKEAAGV